MPPVDFVVICFWRSKKEISQPKTPKLLTKNNNFKVSSFALLSSDLFLIVKISSNLQVNSQFDSFYYKNAQFQVLAVICDWVLQFILQSMLILTVFTNLMKKSGMYREVMVFNPMALCSASKFFLLYLQEGKKSFLHGWFQHEIATMYIRGFQINNWVFQRSLNFDNLNCKVY